MKLTERQRRLLAYVGTYKERMGAPPHTNTVSGHLGMDFATCRQMARGMELHGLIRIDPQGNLEPTLAGYMECMKETGGTQVLVIKCRGFEVTLCDQEVRVIFEQELPRGMGLDVAGAIVGVEARTQVTRTGKV